MPSPPPVESPSAPRAAPRGLSIRWKLFLFIAGLVAIVTIAFGGAAYRAMRESAVSGISVRLDGLAAQWARLFEGSAARQLAALGAVGRSPGVLAALVRRDPATLAAANQAVGGLLPPGQRSAVQLLDRQRHPVLIAGDTAEMVRAPVSPQLLDQASTRDSVTVSPLHGSGEAVLGSYVTRIMVDGAVAGYLAQTTQLQLTPSPEELNKLFGGGTTKVRLANQDGLFWTDLGRQIPGPATPVDFSQHLLTYERPLGGRLFAAAHSIAGTPWMVVMESSEAEVLAPSRHLQVRLLIEGAIALALGAIVAIGMSTSLTRPVERLTEAAEAVAAGDYARQAALQPRRDELGRLASAFDTMVSRVEASFAAQRAAEAYWRGLFEAVPLPIWLYDRETLAILAVNDAAIRHYGYSRDEFLALTVDALRPSEDIPRLHEAIRTSMGQEYHQNDWRHRTKDGTIIDVEVYARSMMFQGRHARLVVVHDITEQNQVQAQVQRSDERYRRLIEESTDGITLSRLDGRFLAVNPAFVRMLGYGSETELFELAPADLYADPEQRTVILAKLAATGRVSKTEVQLRRKDGKILTVQLTLRLVTEPGGSEQYLEAVLADVTELRRVERQFQQAQKMEAVGQLAGGVAHDFNNLLTVILSYSDMLLSESPTDSDREAIQAIRGAAASAAALTRQLLTFSRQEVIQPQVMSLNELIAGTGKMLQRLIGEQVELAIALATDAGSVRVDPGQIEQVIVNLAVNARDAMPEGGRLMIESRNVEVQAPGPGTTPLDPPGRYVALVVSDNGMGMDAATQARIFEPFFTTKGLGKGTGLGLATVYGIVRQSGGHIAVYSEPGRGTSFKIYFPRVDESVETPQAAVETPEAPPGNETILLVEDEAKLRPLIQRILERKGYTVLSAADGAEALDIVARHQGPIHLVLTDVVMPGMNGREVAERVAKLRPDIRVLFMSGYTDDAIVHHGVLEAGVQFIEKPFALAALAGKVRQVLDMR